jgi:hypothetical protein
MKMRAEGHSEADLPPLPSPPKAPYTEQEIDFEVPAYLESLMRAQAGGAGSEEDSPLADNPSACTSSEEGGDFEHATMDKATSASIAVLDDKVWDHVRQDEELRVAVSRLEKLGEALVAAVNTPGEGGRQSYARIDKDMKLQVDELSEAMAKADRKGQVVYELEVMKLAEDLEKL